MAIRQIRIEGDPLLRKKSRVIENIDDRIKILIEDMIDTMKDAEGVGLAAPQVGVLKRVIVIDIGEGPIVGINPKIVESSGEEVDEEGCLSVPGKSGNVCRPKSIIVEYLDKDGNEKRVEANDLLARVFCHEIDHLDGVLYIDKIIDDEKIG
ncbi:MAG: peptide deformylase [Andreesenia angusta]|nr:peptide deformylase [Andreesenia angusta]